MELAQIVFHQPQEDCPQLVPVSSPAPTPAAALVHLLRGTPCTPGDLNRLVRAAATRGSRRPQGRGQRHRQEPPVAPEVALPALATGLGIRITVHTPGSTTSMVVYDPQPAGNATTDTTRSLHLLRVPPSSDPERGYDHLRFTPLQPAAVDSSATLADAALQARIDSIHDTLCPIHPPLDVQHPGAVQ